MRQGDLPFEVFEDVLARNPNLENIELQGEGEPLMHPRIFDMIASAKSRGIAVSMITNGSHFTAANIERILEGGIHSINVSIESPDVEAFRAIRGGKLTKVIDGIKALMTQRRARGLDKPVVGFSVTVLQRTLGDLPALVRLHRELGLDGPLSTQPLQRMDAYTAIYDAEMQAQMLSPPDYREYWNAGSEELRAIRMGSRAYNFYHLLFANWSPRSRTCPWLERGGYVTIDGNVTACCFAKAPQHAFGPVDDEARVTRARDVLRSELRNGQIPAACQGCPTARAIAPTESSPVRLPVVG